MANGFEWEMDADLRQILVRHGVLPEHEPIKKLLEKCGPNIDSIYPANCSPLGKKEPGYFISIKITPATSSRQFFVMSGIISNKEEFPAAGMGDYYAIWAPKEIIDRALAKKQEVADTTDAEKGRGSLLDRVRRWGADRNKGGGTPGGNL